MTTASQIVQRIADTTEPALPSRRRADGRRDGRRNRDGLTSKERKFVDHLIDNDCSASKAYTAATGQDGSAARTGGSRMLARPQVQAAIATEIGKLRTIGRLAGTKRLIKLVDDAKSEYVMADVAKHLSGEQTKAPGGASGVTININLGGERMMISANVPDPTTEG